MTIMRTDPRIGALRKRAVEAVQMPRGRHGLWMEFGTWKGSSALDIREAMPEVATLHCFDSWRGLQYDWRPDRPAGYFDMGGVPPQIPGCEMHPGWFHESLNPFLDTVFHSAAFVHIDCDEYHAASTVLSVLRDRARLREGTVILFDEWDGYEGCEEHEQRAWREIVLPYFNPVKLFCETGRAAFVL